MSPLRLSIVMCTYNGATYLQAQLDSLLAQPDEIVISDDAPIDASMEMDQRPRYRRAIPVLREACAGDYRRYGTGVRSMLRDLLRHD